MVRFTGGEQHTQHARKKIIRMLGKNLYNISIIYLEYQNLKYFFFMNTVVIVLTFFTCWFLFHLQRLWHIYGKNFTYFNDVNEYLFWLAGSFYYIAWYVPEIYKLSQIY